MSGSGAPRISSDGHGRRVAVVASTWHAEVMGGLVAGAERALAQAGADFELIRVPGSFELPLGVKLALERERDPFDAAVALGVVIRGGTPHFEYVCQAAAQGITDVALSTGKPVGFGVLTCDDEQQALDRAGLAGSHEDKGREAVEAALAMVGIKQSLSAV